MRAQPSQGSNRLGVMNRKQFSSNAAQSQRIFNSSDLFRASQKINMYVIGSPCHSLPSQFRIDPVIAKRNKEKDRKRAMEGTPIHGRS